MTVEERKANRIYNYCQPNPWGCLYYSFASLTGDTRYLRQPEVLVDGGPSKFLIRVWEAGYYPCPVYTNEFKNAPRYIWKDLKQQADRLPKDACFDLSVDIPAITGDFHAIGVRFFRGGIYVFDPATKSDRPEYFSSTRFLEENVSNARRITNIQSLDLSRYQANVPKYIRNKAALTAF